MLMLLATTAPADDAATNAEPIRHRITGLFSVDREADLRAAMLSIPEIDLVSIDFDRAEAAFRYDAEKVFPGANAEQVIERFNNLLRNASNHSLGITPLCAMERDKLKFVEIAVGGLDCKGCSFAAYDAIYRLDGVEQATASFKLGLVTAWIDPAKTDRMTLESALTRRGVTLIEP